MRNGDLIEITSHLIFTGETVKIIKKAIALHSYYAEEKHCSSNSRYRKIKRRKKNKEKKEKHAKMVYTFFINVLENRKVLNKLYDFHHENGLDILLEKYSQEEIDKCIGILNTKYDVHAYMDGKKLRLKWKGDDNVNKR